MFWKRKPKFDDVAKDRFIKTIAEMLTIQLVPAPGRSIVDDQGNINRRALGYIYGWIDAALQARGVDMRDQELGPPIAYQVLRHLFPGHEEKCTQFLLNHVRTDNELLLGMMRGGQQFLDFRPPSKGVPMGLARYLMGLNN